MKEKSFDRKKELLDAAMDEFIAKEYKDASLNSIIRKAGISKGTFYYHFKDKEALYLYLLDACADAKMRFLNRRMAECSFDQNNMDIFELFKAQARLGVEFAKEYPKYYRFGYRFINEKGNQVYETGMKLLGSSAEKIFDKMIHKAVENHEFREDVSTEFISRVIKHLLIHYNEIFQWGENLELEGALKNVDDLILFLKRGLEREKIENDINSRKCVKELPNGRNRSKSPSKCFLYHRKG